MFLGREELFERDRHKEPVPGWHRCALACAESVELAVDEPDPAHPSQVNRI